MTSSCTCPGACGGNCNGGGVYNNSSTTTLTNSTVSGNSALYGGGVYNRGTATFTNSTVSGNNAGIEGGGVYNAVATATLARTLISGNTAPTGAEVRHRSSGAVTADDFNLFGHSGLTNAEAFSGFTPGASDITATSDGTDPTPLANILAPLANNGGPTQTHALVAGSPAIDASPDDASCEPFDQRGEPRPQGVACDIGSFEIMAAPSPDLAVDKTDSPDPVLVTDHLTYTITVDNVGEGDATEVMLTDILPASVDFVSVTTSQGSCGESGGTVDCDLGNLANDADVATVTIVVKPTATGTITNSVAVESAETDENPTNNTDTEDTTVNALLCNGLVPTIVGTPGDNTLTGTNKDDVIHGLGGNDIINGGNGNDTICGGEGNDTLNGGNGNDRLFGENGNDALNGNNGDDKLDGGAGSDTCNGGNGKDTGANCETQTSIP
jgi:uncharacterized repeat protein (TIGR01451 family)